MILQRKSRDRSASELRPTQVPQPSEGSAVSATVSASPASGCAGPDLHCGNKAHRQLRWHRFPAGIAARSSNLSADGLAPAQQEQQAAEEQARQRMQTSAGPDGSVFYLEDVSEDTPAEPREVFDNPATPSPVYYNYSSSDTALEYPRQETISGADNAPSAPNVVPPIPTPEPVVYYREVPSQLTPNEKPSSPKVVSPLVTQNSRLPLQTQTLEEFSGEPSYEDDLTSESKTTVSFNTPNMRFEIPSEFRTFLNTPPRWINLDNW